MARKNVIEAWGKVVEELPNSLYRVRMPNHHLLLGHRVGKMRDEGIHILPDDEVLLEISPYDLSRGRIIGIQSKFEDTEGAEQPRLSLDSRETLQLRCSPLTQK